MVQNDKVICHAPYLRNHTSYDCHFWYTCVKWCKVCVKPPGLFFFIFFNFDFSGCSRVKEQKNSPKWQKILSVTLHISSTIDHILAFMVLICNMISSGGFFFFLFFKILTFWGHRGGGKMANNCPKWQKILSVMLDISGTILHMIVIYDTHV